VPVRLGVDDASRHDRAAALERCSQPAQLLRRQAELELQVTELGRPGRREVPEQRVVRAPVQLGSAERVEQLRRLAGDEQTLAAVHRKRQVATHAQLAEPRELRPRPLAEPGLPGRVRRLVAGLEQARQPRVGGAGEEAAVA